MIGHEFRVQTTPRQNRYRYETQLKSAKKKLSVNIQREFNALSNLKMMGEISLRAV